MIIFFREVRKRMPEPVIANPMHYDRPKYRQFPTETFDGTDNSSFQQIEKNLYDFFILEPSVIKQNYNSI